jgi:hypothetical protein
VIGYKGGGINRIVFAKWPDPGKQLFGNGGGEIVLKRGATVVLADVANARIGINAFALFGYAIGGADPPEVRVLGKSCIF